MKLKFKILLLVIILCCNVCFAYDCYMGPELYRAYGKQQIRTKDRKGNTVLVSPNFKSYAERNEYVSEKIVVVYDRRSPAYGYRYVLYTPVGKYVGHHKIMQPSLNGYGYEPIPDGGEGSGTPCFRTIEEAKHYYYPQWY